jgi:radical SAM superfamily enzyme YgiQ (UPF0313 family)
MKRLLLVKLPEPHRPTQKPSYMPPFGLWSIAHNAKGYKVDVLDLHLLGFDRLGPALYSGYDTVGISAQFSIQHQEYLNAVELCKIYNVPEVIAGGFHAAAVPKPNGVDRVYSGDGELAFNTGMTFDAIEYPPASAAMLEPYWAMGSPHDLQSKTKRWTPIEFSRGCDRQCGYCGVRNYWGGSRYYSPMKISDHLDALCAEGIEEVFIEDDNFISDHDAFSWIIGQMGQRKLWWSTPNGIAASSLRGHLGTLARSGCWRVSLPFETGVESTARIMRLGNKWLPFGQALELVHSLREEGIKTCGFFIIGYPGETLCDMQKTLDYANGLPLDQRNVYIATPYPGTPLYDLCKQKGYLVSEKYDDLLYTKGLIETPDFTPDQVEDLKARDRAAAIARMGK